MINHWMPDGERAVEVISEIARLPEEIAKDLTGLLSGRYRYLAMSEGRDNPYDGEAIYEERSPDDSNYRYGWKSFCNEITYQERFFPESAEPILDEIFGNLNALQTYGGTPVIRLVAPKSEDFSIWRARTAQSDEELIAILKCPAQQLGPPPSSFAEAGRMNAKGISVFYGALDKSTCVSEVRPPVGSHVVLGKFQLLRPVRLLDLGALSRVLSSPVE